MKVLNTIIILIILMFSFSSSAQIQVGSATFVKGPGNITKEEFSKFKTTTTYFILQEQDYKNKSAFEDAIAKVWTVTPFKIIHPSEMSQLDMNKSSYFFFGGFVTIRSSATHTHLSYDLYMNNTNKKGKNVQLTLAKFMLHLDGESYRYVSKYASGSNAKFSEKVIPYLYKEAKMNNWSAIMLVGYLKVINDGLKEEKLRSVFEEYVDKEAIYELKSNTLYIPDYVNIKYNMFTGAEVDTDEDDKVLNSAYEYPSQYITLEALEAKAQSDNNGIYYLSYIKSSTDKYISVFNSKTGKMIFTTYVPMSYNFKNKDLKRISSKIK